MAKLERADQQADRVPKAPSPERKLSSGEKFLLLLSTLLLLAGVLHEEIKDFVKAKLVGDIHDLLENYGDETDACFEDFDIIKRDQEVRFLFTDSTDPGVHYYEVVISLIGVEDYRYRQDLGANNLFPTLDIRVIQTDLLSNAKIKDTQLKAAINEFGVVQLGNDVTGESGGSTQVLLTVQPAEDSARTISEFVGIQDTPIASDDQDVCGKIGLYE